MLQNKKATPIQCLANSVSRPGVSVVVPGVSNQEQLRESLAYIDATQQEKDFSSIITKLLRETYGTCLFCNHCQPCSRGIDIGGIFRLEMILQHGITTEAREMYNAFFVNASDCIGCGNCTKRCLFEVNVVEKMEALRRALE